MDAARVGGIFVCARVYTVSQYFHSTDIFINLDDRCERSYMVSRDDYNDPSTKEFRCAMPDCVSALGFE
jgi:hypothetical protein